MSDKQRGRILVADDEEGVRTFLAESLERDGHEVVQAEDGEVALRAARAEPFDVVLTDLKMPKLDGMSLVRALRTEQPDVEIVVLTAHGGVASAVEAMKLGVHDYLEKPISGPAAVRALVQSALERRALLAKGDAAPTVENGAAVAEVLRLTSEAWQTMGPQAREIYVIQHLEELLSAVLAPIHNLKVREVSVLDPGDGSSVAAYAASYPHAVAAVLSALRETTGVDVPAILAGKGGAA